MIINTVYLTGVSSQDLVYGIAASKSLRITSIARTLNESIKLESTITRMDRLINDDDFKADLFGIGYVAMVKSIVDVNNMIVMVDDTDINKKYSKKLEDLDRVRDGSSTKKVNITMVIMLLKW